MVIPWRSASHGDQALDLGMIEALDRLHQDAMAVGMGKFPNKLMRFVDELGSFDCKVWQFGTFDACCGKTCVCVCAFFAKPCLDVWIEKQQPRVD